MLSRIRGVKATPKGTLKAMAAFVEVQEEGRLTSGAGSEPPLGWMDVVFWNSLPEEHCLGYGIWGPVRRALWEKRQAGLRVKGGKSEPHEHTFSSQGTRWPCRADRLPLIWRADAGSSSDQRTTEQLSSLGPVMDNPTS